MASYSAPEQNQQHSCVNGLWQRFSNCGPRTTSGHWVLPLWSF